MAAPRPAGAVAAAGPPPEAPGGFFANPTVQTLVKSFAIFMGIQFLMGPNSPFKSAAPAFSPPTSVSDARSATAGDGATPAPSGVIVATPANAAPKLDLVSLWPASTLLDISIRLSMAEDGVVDFGDESLPSVTWEGVDYAAGKWGEEWDTEWDVPAAVQHNASLWADIFVTQTGVSPNPASPSYSANDTLHIRKALTRFAPKRKIREVKNLLSNTAADATTAAVEEEPEKKEVMPIISYYHPNVSVEIVTNPGIVAYSQLPPTIANLIHVAHEGERNVDGTGLHFPVTWVNDFWLLKEHQMPINDTTTRLPLRITLGPTSMMKFQIYASLDDSFSKQAASTGGSGSEFDEVKRMLTETNPILLITTVLVSLLHMLFEMLAFTSDITHWRNKKQLVGVSVRTILTNCFIQLVILLYLLDNNENTSWMILAGQGMGLAIEAWKITKAVDIKVVPSPTTWYPYTLDIKDKHVLSDDELKTQEYDKLAFRYVSYGTVPLLAGYTVYSMVYNEHRSWYSFVISTLTSFVYAFGFIQLIPGLIINYKLKSVAHLPMKTLTYKFFNTIVDDFFSFVIKMPILHRLACFRDDVVFLILLYQMYLYKVDPTRANEYGQQLTEEEAAKLLAENEKKAIEAPGAGGEKKESKKDI